MKKRGLVLLSMLCGAVLLSGCFAQKNDSSSTSNSSDRASSTQSSSLVEEAVYKVTFKQNGYKDVVREVKEGEDLTDIPATQPKEGYTVVWENVALTNIQSDITVNAQEEANEYKVTYELYENGYVDCLIMTGGVGNGNETSDAYVAKQYAISKGIPEEAIFIEEKSTITEENLKNAKAIMAENSLDTAIIVSDPLHMKRAMTMAKDYGIIAYSSPTPTTMYKSNKTKIPFLAREVFFYIGYSILRPFR